MLDHPTRIQAWLEDLAAIVASMDAVPPLPPKPTRKRTRKLKPLWEE